MSTPNCAPTNGDQGQGDPIQIYKISGETRELDMAAFGSVLTPVKQLPVAFVSLNGPMRSGKSFLLNFFLRYLRMDVKSSDWLERSAVEVFGSTTAFNGFKWRGGAERHTMGIWIWSEPFIIDYKNPSGVVEKIAVILMDTQGSFDGHTSFQDNAIIFAISVWLSSVFIYNIQDNLSEDKLQFLEYFSDFSDGLKTAAFGDNSSGASASGPSNVNSNEALFQHLLLLIRDWRWPDDYEYGWHSRRGGAPAKNHVTDFINGNANSAAESLATRKDIVAKFSDTSSFLLPHPGMTIHGRVQDSLPPKEKIEADFLANLQSLVVTVFQKVMRPKTIFGEVKSGRDILALLHIWADLLKSNRIPEVKDFNRATAEAHLEVALHRGLKLCQQQLFALSMEGSSDEEFTMVAETICATVVSKFSEDCKQPNLARHSSKYVARLLDRTKHEQTVYAQFNVSKRTERVQTVAIREMVVQTQNMGADNIRLQGQMAQYQHDIEDERRRAEQDRREGELKLQAVQNSVEMLNEHHAQEKAAADRQMEMLITLASRPPQIVYVKSDPCVIM